MRREALARTRRTPCGAWISALGNERFDRRDAGVDFFEDKRALLIEIRVNGLALLFRAAALPVSIEGFEDQLQLDDLFVCVRIAGLQISDFVLQDIGARGLCGHRQDHGFQRIDIIRELEIGWCHARK